MDHPGLVEILDRARRLGFTGEASATEQIAHALRFLTPLGPLSGVPAVGASDGMTGVDLGSGAGLPGLVLALALPDSRWVLVESMARRAAPLAEAVERLDLTSRVEVWCGRAEAFADEPGRRGAVDVVTARGFGSPAVTAECGAPLLRLGGLLVVSEPPESNGSRWPPSELAVLGLAPVGVSDGVMVCQAMEPCPETFPRAVGRPAKRPLF